MKQLGQHLVRQLPCAAYQLNALGTLNARAAGFKQQPCVTACSALLSSQRQLSAACTYAGACERASSSPSSNAPYFTNSTISDAQRGLQLCRLAGFQSLCCGSAGASAAFVRPTASDAARFPASLRSFAAAAASEDTGGAPLNDLPPDVTATGGGGRYSSSGGTFDVRNAVRRRLMDPPNFMAVEFFADGTVIEHAHPRTAEEVGIHPRDISLFVTDGRCGVGPTCSDETHQLCNYFFASCLDSFSSSSMSNLLLRKPDIELPIFYRLHRCRQCTLWRISAEVQFCLKTRCNLQNKSVPVQVCSSARHH